MWVVMSYNLLYIYIFKIRHTTLKNDYFSLLITECNFEHFGQMTYVLDSFKSTHIEFKNLRNSKNHNSHHKIEKIVPKIVLWF